MNSDVIVVVDTQDQHVTARRIKSCKFEFEDKAEITTFIFDFCLMSGLSYTSRRILYSYNLGIKNADKLNFKAALS